MASSDETNPISPTSTTSSRRRSQDTGFHEPFSEERNTTLPHPSATHEPGEEVSLTDIGANAPTHGGHVNLLAVRRRSLLRRHRGGGSGSGHKRVNSGKITAENAMMMHPPGEGYDCNDLPHDHAAGSSLVEEDAHPVEQFADGTVVNRGGGADDDDAAAAAMKKSSASSSSEESPLIGAKLFQSIKGHTRDNSLVKKMGLR